MTKNPMKAETRRSFRKFFGLGKMSARAVRSGAIFFAVLYGLILWYSVANTEDADSAFWSHLETAILLIVGSMGFFGAISGERERRTWDVLRSLPVTRTQIVVGKFIGAVVVVTMVWGVLLPFNLITVLKVSSDVHHTLGFRIERDLLAALVSYFCALLTISLTLLLSSRSRTSLAALSTSLAVLFLWLAVWPLFLGFFYNDHGADDSWLLTMNPFAVVAQIYDHEHPLVASLSFFLFCLIGVAILITWTDKTLNFSEDKAEFVRHKDHA